MRVKVLLLSVLLSVSFTQRSYSDTELCLKVFESAREEVLSKVLRDKALFLREYKGQLGYARFVEELEKTDSMDYVFDLVSKSINKEEKGRLGWQGYKGKVSGYREERLRILNEKGEIREEYIGMEGYARFAEEYYAGYMEKAYINVSSVLEKSEKGRLGWQKYAGKVSGYREERLRILNEKGEIREEYIGMEGYARFAEEYYAGDMKKAYINVSSVLGGVHATRKLGLGWKQIQGSVSQFNALKEIFSIYSVKELKEMQSQIARDIFDGDKSKLYVNVSVLREELIGDRETFNKLNWQR